MAREDFWNNREQAQKLIEESNAVRNKIEPLLETEKQLADLQVMVELCEAEPEEAVAVETAGSPAKATSAFAGQGHLPQGGLSLATAQKQEGGGAPLQMYTRGEFTFNRRFFETKFPGFFRIVPSEAEKDLVIVIKAVRGEYVGKRISRISSNEMHIQLQSGNASAEVMIPFAEIQSVQIRHKDAKS